jgi:hypothetical protein
MPHSPALHPLALTGAPARARRLAGIGLALLLAGSALAGLSGLARALDLRSGRMTLPQGLNPKDFAILKRDSTWHLFYIVQNGPNEKVIGHSTSRNLYTWTRQPHAITVRTSEWDNESVWAPSIVEHDGVTYMFYTGVHNGPPAWTHEQMTGVAFSMDPSLVAWSRLDVSSVAPVQRCSDFVWTNCLQDWPTFRDPFVMRDPADSTQWLSFLTTRVNTTPGDPLAAAGLLPDWGTSSVVSVARSGSDFGTWQPVRMIEKTHRTWTDPDPTPGHETSGFRTVESPHVFRHGGLWYLCFTSYTEPRVMFLTSPDLLGGASSWTLRGMLADNPPPGQPGFPTSGWAGTEYVADGADEYFCTYADAGIEIRKIVWGPQGDWRFTLVPPFRVDAIWFEDSYGAPVSKVVDGDPVRISVMTRTWQGRKVPLEVVRLAGSTGQQIVPAGAYGIPAMLTPTDWLMRVSFTAHSDSRDVERLIVRSREFPETFADTLEIYPRGTGGGGGDDFPDNRRVDVPGSAAPMLALRALRGSPLGPGLALQIEMPAAGLARLDLFDVRGARVRSLLDRRLPKGATLEPWDERDGSGALVAPGIYFARLRTEAGTRSVRLAVAR